MTRAPGPADVDLSRFSLLGRTAVITGASRNIGAALAVGFARAGADLVLVARDPERLARHAEFVRSESGREVVEVAVDVADPGALDRIVEGASRLPGGVDVLVNNAYSVGSVTGPVATTPDSVWDEVLATNLLAPVRLCRHFAAGMAESGGSIINVVSGSGLLPGVSVAPYGVSKAALWTLTRYLAVELAPRVRVNALCPGITSPDGDADELQAQLLPQVPMKRLARPEEVVGAAIYLASDAASYTTGELLIVNGGRPW